MRKCEVKITELVFRFLMISKEPIIMDCGRKCAPVVWTFQILTHFLYRPLSSRLSNSDQPVSSCRCCGSSRDSNSSGTLPGSENSAWKFFATVAESNIDQGSCSEMFAY